MTDIKRLRQFADKLEWEGGFSEMIRYGLFDSGDVILNELLKELSSSLERTEERWAYLESEYRLYDRDEDE